LFLIYELMGILIVSPKLNDPSKFGEVKLSLKKLIRIVDNINPTVFIIFVELTNPTIKNQH
jgi:hypothetical protein